MSNLLDLNPKFNGYGIEDLQRLGSLGNEEAIMELGRRVLDEDFNYECDCEECPDCPDECPECGYEFW